MKLFKKQTLFVLFILAETLSVYVYAAVPITNCNPASTPAARIKPKINICFTIARRRDCDGFGICNWTASLTDLRLNGCSGTITADDASGKIFTIEIDKLKGISSDTYRKYFSSGIFILEDDAPVPSDLLNNLSISGSRILPAGKYPVMEKNGVLTLVIASR